MNEKSHIKRLTIRKKYMIRVFKPYRSRETVEEPLTEGSSCSSCSDDSAKVSALAVVAFNSSLILIVAKSSSPVAFSNSNVVGGNFVVEGHVVVGGRGVGVQAEVGPSDPGSVLVEISRPQYAFIIGIFARVNSWTGFVAIVVPDISFSISNSSSVKYSVPLQLLSLESV